ncbi:hypothetical protein MAHJHV63_16440 [Mycobacterium avium subsp. hominissuis]
MRIMVAAWNSTPDPVAECTELTEIDHVADIRVQTCTTCRSPASGEATGKDLVNRHTPSLTRGLRFVPWTAGPLGATQNRTSAQLRQRPLLGRVAPVEHEF